MLYDKKLVYRAGTIPYIVEDGKVSMLFMRPSNPDFGGDALQIAKGKIEEGETEKEAALREAKEEIGLFIGNVVLTEEVGTFMGRTTVFVAKIKSRDMFGEPSFETSETEWLTLEQFDSVGRDLHRPVVRAAHRKICKLEGIEAE